MKHLIKIHGAFILISMTVFGCTDITDNIDSSSNNTTNTRALQSTDYYWYNGQKIGINKLNNKKYILFDENNENTLKSYSGTTLKFEKEPQLLQLSNKIMKKKLQSSPQNLKWNKKQLLLFLSLLFPHKPKLNRPFTRFGCP